MNINEIKTKALDLIERNQDGCSINAETSMLAYTVATVAYNDGVMDFMNAIISDVEEKSIIPEQVNHPSHYNQEGKKECIEQMREDYGDTITVIFCLTNAYKYLYRAGAKEGNSKAQDIAKARWYYNYATNHSIIIQGDLAHKLNEFDHYICEQLDIA